MKLYFKMKMDDFPLKHRICSKMRLSLTFLLMKITFREFWSALNEMQSLLRKICIQPRIYYSKKKKKQEAEKMGNSNEMNASLTCEWKCYVNCWINRMRSLCWTHSTRYLSLFEWLNKFYSMSLLSVLLDFFFTSLYCIAFLL